MMSIIGSDDDPNTGAFEKFAATVPHALAQLLSRPRASQLAIHNGG
jgi:hypothetical protein